MKRLLISGMVALLIALMVTMAVQAAPPDPLLFQKDCSSGFPPSCTIPTSTLAILEGGTLTYDGLIDLTRMFISSEVELVALDGSTAMGHFVFIGDHGYFTFRPGTGNLAGFHAQGEIGPPDASWVFPLTGTYHFDSRKK